jgi:ABC-type branched-subunit amino acid transport system substrate-binding protein
LEDNRDVKPSRHLRAVIITPFDDDGRRVATAISEGLDRAGFEVIRLESMFRPGSPVTVSMTEAIATANLVVADLSRPNANVYYELGFAHGLRKPTILVTSSEGAANVASDLQGFLYLAYDRSDLTRLVEEVRRAALVSSGPVAAAR